MMQAYADYKDSGVDWLREIPAGWDAKRMRYLYRDISEKNQPNAELLSVTQSQGVVPRDWVKNRMVMPSGNLASFKFIKKGDFAISLRSFEGGLEYCHHNGIISPAYTVLKSARDDLFQGYYKFLFKSLSFISEIQMSIVGIREGKNISFEELSYSLMPLPSLPEQTAIAEFLDEKTAKIEALVAIKRRQIELLAERKQILIQNAVTKGLNPDVAMKDSGIDWIGEIPAHWEATKLRYLGTFQNGISAGAEYFGSGFPFVTYGDVYKNPVLHSKPSGLAKSSIIDRLNYSIQKGDVLFTRTSEVANDIGVSSTCLQTIKDVSFSGFVIRMRPVKETLIPEFSSYLFRSSYVGAYFSHEMNIVIRASLGQELLKNLPIFLPSLNEQKEIVGYCMKEAKKIDAAITIKQNQITKLNEYKITLINATVTGKINVTGA